MKSKTAIYLLVLLVLPLFSCAGGPTYPRPASIEEVEEVFGVPVPQPQLLPPGAIPDKVTLSDNTTASFFYRAEDGENLELRLYWRSRGGPGHRIGIPGQTTIGLPGFIGSLETEGSTKEIAWNLPYWHDHEGDTVQGVMIARLFVPVEVPDLDLASLAASVRWE